MNKFIPAGRLFFAIALTGLAAEHFIYQDFITGRAPAWPAIPGKLIWAYVSGLFFFAVACALILKKKARLLSVIASLLILSWAFIRNIPVVADDVLLGGAWTQAGKSLFFFGALLAAAGALPEEQDFNNAKLNKSGFTFWKLINMKREFFHTGRICLGIFLTISGIQHFIFIEFVASLIPSWFPGNPVFWSYFGGAALIAGGLGLLIPYTVMYAGLFVGLMVFCWVWIIHVPRISVSVSDNIAVFEALAVSGTAFILAGCRLKGSD